MKQILKRDFQEKEFKNEIQKLNLIPSSIFKKKGQDHHLQKFSSITEKRRKQKKEKTNSVYTKIKAKVSRIFLETIKYEQKNLEKQKIHSCRGLFMARERKQR